MRMNMFSFTFKILIISIPLFYSVGATVLPNVIPNVIPNANIPPQPAVTGTPIPTEVTPTTPPSVEISSVPLNSPGINTNVLQGINLPNLEEILANVARQSSNQPQTPLNSPADNGTPVLALTPDSLEERASRGGLLPGINLEEILSGMASQTSPFSFALPSLTSMFSSPIMRPLAYSPPNFHNRMPMRYTRNNNNHRPVMIQIPPQILEEFNANGINVMPLEKCKYCNDRGRHTSNSYNTQGFRGNPNNNRHRDPKKFFQRGNRAAYHENQAAYRAMRNINKGQGPVQQQIQQQIQQIQQHHEVQQQQQPYHPQQEIQQQQHEIQQQVRETKGGDYQGGFRPMNYPRGGNREGSKYPQQAESFKKIVVVVLQLKDGKLQGIKRQA